MSIPKFKRKPSGLDYVDNAFELQKDIMNLASKLSARWARIYQQPIDKLACMQADILNIVNGNIRYLKMEKLYVSLLFKQ